jgi:uncharacterized protein YbjT (DUF2867 family)
METTFRDNGDSMPERFHQKTIFISGGTGYMGRTLIPKLLTRGHLVHVLVRAGSERKVSAGCVSVVGDALNSASFEARVPEGCVFVHLLGAPRPAPWKGKQFRAIDVPSVKASLAAALAAKVSHFVYVSVAHPAPVMTAYIECRQEGEAKIRTTGMAASILQPWYVLGPGHRWPLALLPFYALFERLPATREASRRLALVTIKQMMTALLWAIEHDPTGVRVLGVPEIRNLST